MSITREQGSISVNTENIFPIIKRSLYSDHEIFLRELVSNAIDATRKLRYLAGSGEYQGETGDLKVSVSLNKEARTLTVSDMGIGMTADEVRKYINQVAFSGAQEFVNKFQEAGETQDIIGRFGLGFYSAFMVSEKVEIKSLSWQEGAEAITWDCDGSTSYSLEAGEKTERGTDIILHIDKDSDEFLENARIHTLLTKYFRFIDIAVEFEGERINPTQPLWKQKPSEITAEQYKEFYKELHPFGEDPLFWIHLNIDYPFNLTGILYFPQIKKDLDPNRNKIQLYVRQVFITDQVKDIVPDYLMLLHGVIDSPDIPLNVSRSYLQGDPNVKKIAGYITKKVADKLNEIFRDNREDYEKKWKDIAMFVKYGMVTDEKFDAQADKFFLMENSEGHTFTLAEYKDKITAGQTDKDGNLVYLYTNDAEKQDVFVKAANAKGYDVLVMDGVIDAHVVSHLERKGEKTRWARVDSDTVNNLIKKSDEENSSDLNEDQKTSLTTLFQSVAEGTQFNFKAEALGEKAMPILITRPEFMRRMQEMAATGGGNPFMGSIPETFQVLVNTDNVQVKKLVENQDKDNARHLWDLALLTQDMLKGAQLTAFIERTVNMMGKN